GRGAGVGTGWASIGAAGPPAAGAPTTGGGGAGAGPLRSVAAAGAAAVRSLDVWACPTEAEVGAAAGFVGAEDPGCPLAADFGVSVGRAAAPPGESAATPLQPTRTRAVARTSKSRGAMVEQPPKSRSELPL